MRLTAEVVRTVLFANTQDILNILVGSLLENEPGEDTVILRDKRQFSGEGLTDDDWKIIC